MPTAKKAAIGGHNFFDKIRGKKTAPARGTKVIPVAGKKAKTAKAVSGNSGSKYKETFDKSLVFVAMSFKGEGGDDAFRAIKEAAKSIRLNARRVDENYSSGFIILEIIELIEKAEFIIFDLTYERPNVYYELGYAHGVGNSPSNILLLAKEGTELHFDIAALRVHYYKSTEDLRQIIKRTLTEMIKASRNL